MKIDETRAAEAQLATLVCHDQQRSRRKKAMAWKYIMFENKIGDTKYLFPVIFPDKMVHSDVAMALRPFQPGWNHGGVRPVSAGTIEHVETRGLGGESVTLHLKANPCDEEIIDLYEYGHGIFSG